MENVGSLIKRYNHLLSEIEGVYHDLSFKLGVSDSVSKFLYTLCLSDGRCPLSQICRQTGLSKQTVNSAVRKLEEQGMILLMPVSGKKKDVVLTDGGKLLADKTARRIIEMENCIFASWDPGDLHHYLSMTEEFLRSLQSQAQNI